MLEPKFKRPGKPGHIWPGVYRIPKSYPAASQKHPWHFNCPAPLCFYRGSYTDELMARKIQETHQCPWFGGGKTTLSWGIMSDMFLAPIWADLDGLMDIIKSDESSEEEKARCRYAARGVATALAHLMPPFFHTWEEIATEAAVRWQARQKGEDYETPGIGRLRFAVPPGAEKLTPSGIPHHVAAGTKHAPEHHPSTAVKNFGIPDATVELILQQSKQGFDARILATVHGIAEGTIKALLARHG